MQHLFERNCLQKIYFEIMDLYALLKQIIDIEKENAWLEKKIATATKKKNPFSYFFPLRLFTKPNILNIL